ncbi:unnamed protein product [Haemonchus placei]|uniref:Dynein light chain n=1 Tax=Haemonchus placei TaxID=6290 RepID=A0A0N4X054_HAEPC|nr:unnamed protein product [Haemonchus placei]
MTTQQERRRPPRLENEVVFEHSDGGDIDDNNNDRAEPQEEGRLELEHWLNVLKKLVESKRKVPEIKINMHDPMQDKGHFFDVRSVSPKVCTIETAAQLCCRQLLLISLRAH